MNTILQWLGFGWEHMLSDYGPLTVTYYGAFGTIIGTKEIEGTLVIRKNKYTHDVRGYVADRSGERYYLGEEYATKLWFNIALMALKECIK